MFASVISSGAESLAELTDADMMSCGSAYCPAQILSADNTTHDSTDDAADNQDHLKNDNFKTDFRKIHIITGIYLVCSIVSALIIAFLVDPLTRCMTVLRRKSHLPLSDLVRMRGRKRRKILQVDSYW